MLDPSLQRAAATAEIQERVCRRCDCANADCYYSCRNCQPPKKSIVLEVRRNNHKSIEPQYLALIMRLSAHANVFARPHQRDDVTKGTQNEDKAFAMVSKREPSSAVGASWLTALDAPNEHPARHD